MRKVHTGTMPPSNMPQPSQDDRRALLSWLETSLDAASAARPNPGRTDTLRRLNRTEYQNAIRDLLALDIDAASLLPPDDSGHGFDNVTVGDLSPTLLDRYISAAQKISRLAVGSTQPSLQSDIIRLPADLTQEEHLPGLPLGTRGGVSVSHTFAQDGEYEIQIWLARDLNGNVERVARSRARTSCMVLARPDSRSRTFTVEKPADGDDTAARQGLESARPVTAGPHELGVTFVKDASSLLETARQPLQSHFNEHRHPRITPAIYQVSITGPYAAKGAETRRAAAGYSSAGPNATAGGPRHEEEACAKTILATLMRRAYRRPIAKADVEGPMAFYREGRAEKDFDAGIEMALSAVLVNPEFLFRVESEPDRRPRRRASTASAISSWRRGCRSSSGAASPTTSCSTRRSQASSASPAVLEQQVAADAGRSRARATWRPTSPGSGCTCATWTSVTRTCVCSRTSTTTCARRSARRPSCSSRASCARIAACSIC